MNEKTIIRLAVISVIALITVVIAVVIAVRRKDLMSRERASSPVYARLGDVKVPIIMYHSILSDPTLAGDYVLSPSVLEDDIRGLRAEGFTFVSLKMLSDYCKGTAELPVKPIVLTFDDGHYNFMTNVLPLLEKYDICASLSVVGRFTEAAGEEAYPSEAYSYLDVDNLNKLLSSGRIELVNHSYNMHSLENRRGTMQLSTESFEEYRRNLLNDTYEAQRFFSDNCGVTPEAYAFPFGLNCKAGRTVISMCSFNAVLGVEEKVNIISKGNPESLFMLGRFNRPSGISTEDFIRRICQ